VSPTGQQQPQNISSETLDLLAYLFSLSSDICIELAIAPATASAEARTFVLRAGALQSIVRQNDPPSVTKPKLMRFRVESRDVPTEVIARRLGMSLEEFGAALPNLIARGFPQPDPDTLNFDLVAADRWCDARHPHLFDASAQMRARDASTVAKSRIEAMRKAGKAAA
jgi:hypothetical protein